MPYQTDNQFTLDFSRAILDPLPPSISGKKQYEIYQSWITHAPPLQLITLRTHNRVLRTLFNACPSNFCKFLLGVCYSYRSHRITQRAHAASRWHVYWNWHRSFNVVPCLWILCPMYVGACTARVCMCVRVVNSRNLPVHAALLKLLWWACGPHLAQQK